MPTRETAPSGAPCWVDLMSSDLERARQFYCDLFGWEAEEPNEELGGYLNFSKDGVRVAGGFRRQPGMENVPDVWSVYLATDDAEKTVETATASGAQVIAPPMAVQEFGTMAVITDPGGAAVGMWQPGTHKGSGIVFEAGAPSWWELHTRDYDTVVPFYRDVFGWDTHTMGDTPEFRYTTLANPDGEGWLAGVMDASGFLPEGVPSHWAVYFGVDDADAALARIVELGGSVVQPAEDTPYGRLAGAADPTGAQFRLVAPNEQMPAKPKD